MKMFVTMMVVVLTTGCGTLGGAMQGASDDFNRAGEYIRGMGR
jgi:hypothetical protein